MKKMDKRHHFSLIINRLVTVEPVYGLTFLGVGEPSELAAARRSSSSRRRVKHPSAAPVWLVFNL